MLSTIRPLLRPLPVLGFSATGLLLAATLSTQSRSITTMGSSSSWPIKQYTPRHSSWPYSPSDFTRQDSTPDSFFYSDARFVTHIDDAAIASLRQYYDTVLPRKGRILDFCSSWVSHYPKAVEDAAAAGELKVTGMGMNKAELDKNAVLNSGRLLVDLNKKPEIAAALRESGAIGDSEEQYLDAATNVVSTDYLTQPVAVLSSLRDATKTGGTVHLAISNRCFPTKAISRWLRIGEEQRLMMVGDFLHFAGWQKIEIVELSNGTVENGGEPVEHGSLRGLMASIGMNSRDPIWVVRATKE